MKHDAKIKILREGIDLLFNALTEAVERRFEILKDIMDKDENVKVVIAGQGNEHRLGKGFAVDQFEEYFYQSCDAIFGKVDAKDISEIQQLLTSLFAKYEEKRLGFLDKIQALSDELSDSKPGKVSFGFVGSGKNNAKQIHVWGANMYNATLGLGDTIPGDGQAEFMGIQSAGSLAVITTPLAINPIGSEKFHGDIRILRDSSDLWITNNQSWLPSKKTIEDEQSSQLSQHQAVSQSSLGSRSFELSDYESIIYSDVVRYLTKEQIENLRASDPDKKQQTKEAIFKFLTNPKVLKLPTKEVINYDVKRLDSERILELSSLFFGQQESYPDEDIRNLGRLIRASDFIQNNEKINDFLTKLKVNDPKGIILKEISSVRDLTLEMLKLVCTSTNCKDETEILAAMKRSKIPGDPSMFLKSTKTTQEQAVSQSIVTTQSSRRPSIGKVISAGMTGLRRMSIPKRVSFSSTSKPPQPSASALDSSPQEFSQISVIDQAVKKAKEVFKRSATSNPKARMKELIAFLKDNQTNDYDGRVFKALIQNRRFIGELVKSGDFTRFISIENLKKVIGVTQYNSLDVVKVVEDSNLPKKYKDEISDSARIRAKTLAKDDGLQTKSVNKSEKLPESALSRHLYIMDNFKKDSMKPEKLKYFNDLDEGVKIELFSYAVSKKLLTDLDLVIKFMTYLNMNYSNLSVLVEFFSTKDPKDVIPKLKPLNLKDHNGFILKGLLLYHKKLDLSMIAEICEITNCSNSELILEKLAKCEEGTVTIESQLAFRKYIETNELISPQEKIKIINLACDPKYEVFTLSRVCRMIENNSKFDLSSEIYNIVTPPDPTSEEVDKFIGFIEKYNIKHDPEGYVLRNISKKSKLSFDQLKRICEATGCINKDLILRVAKANEMNQEQVDFFEKEYLSKKDLVYKFLEDLNDQMQDALEQRFRTLRFMMNNDPDLKVVIAGDSESQTHALGTGFAVQNIREYLEEHIAKFGIKIDKGKYIKAIKDKVDLLVEDFVREYEGRVTIGLVGEGYNRKTIHVWSTDIRHANLALNHKIDTAGQGADMVKQGEGSFALVTSWGTRDELFNENLSGNTYETKLLRKFEKEWLINNYSWMPEELKMAAGIEILDYELPKISFNYQNNTTYVEDIAFNSQIQRIANILVDVLINNPDGFLECLKRNQIQDVDGHIISTIIYRLEQMDSSQFVVSYDTMNQIYDIIGCQNEKVRSHIDDKVILFPEAETHGHVASSKTVSEETASFIKGVMSSNERPPFSRTPPSHKYKDDGSDSIKFEGNTLPDIMKIYFEEEYRVAKSNASKKGNYEKGYIEKKGVGVYRGTYNIDAEFLREFKQRCKSQADIDDKALIEILQDTDHLEDSKFFSEYVRYKPNLISSNFLPDNKEDWIRFFDSVTGQKILDSLLSGLTDRFIDIMQQKIAPDSSEFKEATEIMKFFQEVVHNINGARPAQVKGLNKKLEDLQQVIKDTKLNKDQRENIIENLNSFAKQQVFDQFPDTRDKQGSVKEFLTKYLEEIIDVSQLTTSKRKEHKSEIERFIDEKLPILGIAAAFHVGNKAIVESINTECYGAIFGKGIPISILMAEKDVDDNVQGLITYPKKSHEIASIPSTIGIVGHTSSSLAAPSQQAQGFGKTGL